MAVNFLELIAGTHVDLGGLEQGLEKAASMAEGAAKKISEHFGAIAIGITTAIAGAVIVALERAIHTTAEWGMEMEHLSNRMGVTAAQAATLVGVMEKYGISAGVAARSMQIMAMEAKQTTESLDPFQTKMGRLLGTLRDSNGQTLNMAQVFDLARQKVSAASTETEKLQIAQSLVGTRMAGQLLPILKLTNEQWDKMKQSEEGLAGIAGKAAQASLEYKRATGELEQQFLELQVTLGTLFLPVITNIVAKLSEWADKFKSIVKDMGEGSSQIQAFWLRIAEKIGVVDEGTADIFLKMGEYQEAGEKAKAALEGQAESLENSEKREAQLVQLARERVSLMEKGRSLGIAADKDVQAAVQAELARLESQRKLLEQELSAPGLTGDQRFKLEADLQKNRIQAAEVVADAARKQYQEEELHLKAIGALNMSTELELLQRKLNDEAIIGSERLKLEAEIYDKRRKYIEDAIKVGRQLGVVSADEEISYRKQKAAEALGKGDVLGASQEIIKARDLAIQQADQVMEFTKKIRVMSLQDEISFQRQKLELVRGNAEEEMKIISRIADLDKQQYDKRLEFSLNYTQGIVGQYQKIMDAAKKTGETETFERARVESERQLVEATREAGGVLRGGGTGEQRQAAVDFAQFVYKQIEQMQSLGKEVTGVWQDAASTAKDILKAASGGEEVRAPGGPSPTVGSILSPVEGLATEGLARGSDIPRLDTSFTDLSVRIRDVLLGTIPNIQNFSNQLGVATKQLAQLTGTPNNPGIVGPGGGLTTNPTQGSGALSTGGGTPAPPTVGPGSTSVQPSTVIGVGGFASSEALAAKMDSVIAALSDLPVRFTETIQDQQAANAQSLSDALNQALTARQQRIAVDLNIDPNAGANLISALVNEVQQ